MGHHFCHPQPSVLLMAYTHSYAHTHTHKPSRCLTASTILSRVFTSPSPGPQRNRFLGHGCPSHCKPCRCYPHQVKVRQLLHMHLIPASMHRPPWLTVRSLPALVQAHLHSHSREIRKSHAARSSAGITCLWLLCLWDLVNFGCYGCSSCAALPTTGTRRS